MAEEQEKNKKLNHLLSEKNRKDANTVKKMLTHERNLKLDAFQRVDELQTQVCVFSESRSSQLGEKVNPM